ncbi:hypothetical protein BD626DRAFT_514165 [Schizophyllum amplum]|uniref:Uncharacterized protein n=1 Tax=Schizophyllum amplum TaxID=97359 RepID=A0A550BYT5_9AGAR|nr:hypothetical protein BD626DRAFT_514165 [Auriculariopsis ampla]
MLSVSCYHPHPCDNHHLHEEYKRIEVLRELALQLVGRRPFSSGTTQKTTLAMVKTRIGPTFTTLASEPPSSAIVYDEDLLAVVLASFKTCYIIWNASKAAGNGTLAPMMRTLWSHIIGWSVFFHPSQDHIIDVDGLGHARFFQVDGIVQVYHMIIESDDQAHVKQFLHIARPTSLSSP